MKNNNIAVGILAHVDAGKTTLSEAMLYLSGSLRKLGRVDHQDAFLDNFALERDRGITIFSKQAIFETGNRRITLLDTPGHVDFSAEMERTLQVLDYAVLVISGADGVQGHTETLWKLLKIYQIPAFIFINKMDQPGTDREALLAELKERLDENCIAFPEEKWTEEALEELAMTDEAVLDHYMESGDVKEEEIRRLIRERKVFPCYFGSALKLNGVEELLSGFSKYTEPFAGSAKFGAKVFKISRDEKGERLTFLKVTGGTLKVKMPIGDEKVNQIRLYSGAKYTAVPEAAPGSVCAVTGPGASYAGQGLGNAQGAAAPLLEPVLTYRMILPEGTDGAKVYREFKQLEEEEPELHITWNAESAQIHVQLMGEVQTEILKSLIAERFHLAVEFGEGAILYKETISKEIVGVGHYEPLRHYAEVHLRMEPLPAGSGLVFASECSEDKLDKNWQRLILTHLAERDHPGVLTGAPVTDMKITLTAGRAHLKHTEGGDFRQATYRAVRQGLKMAGEDGNVLLEPWYSFSLELPSGQVGRAMSDLGQMHGSFSEPETAGGDTVRLTGTVPASEVGDYAKEVLAYTKGRGRLSLTLKGYEPCHNAEEVLAQTAYNSDQDTENPTGSVFCAHGAGFFVPWDQVPEYMHIKEDTRKDNPEDGAASADPSGLIDSARTGGAAAGKESGRGAGGDNAAYRSYGDDPELLAIMEREFGKKQQEKDRYSRYRSGSGGGAVKPRAAAPNSLGTQENARSFRHLPHASDTGLKDEKKSYLLVDGYNIIFAWDELDTLAKSSLAAARSKLMDILSNYQGFVGCTLILVFDAYRVKGNPGSVEKYHNIYVVYTKEAETADQYIEKTTHEIGRKYQVTVATSDATEQIIVMGQGAYRISARDFLEEVERTEEQIREINEKEKKPAHNYLLDYAEKETAEEMERVRLGKE